ncbi:MAG: serine hydrolase domain-containing protein [Planctomycetota bacterium]|nr:serine hydrolase domain-containing protein [Planctomycetota bacterium]
MKRNGWRHAMFRHAMFRQAVVRGRPVMDPPVRNDQVRRSGGEYRGRYGSHFCGMLLLVCLFFGEWSPSVRAQTGKEKWTEDPAVSALLERMVDKGEAVGLVSCVIRNGEIISIAKAGVRKFGQPTTITLQDQLHLGSCTKAMTATLAALLVEEGKISWDTRLLDVFPRLRDGIHEDYHAITLTDLLSHQAGVPTNNLGKWPVGKTVRSLRYEVVRKSLAAKPEQQRGQYHYSNLGYIIAGAMMEKVTNRKWEDLVGQRLFQPLGMKSAGFGAPGKRRGTGGKKNKSGSSRIVQPWGHARDLQGKWKPNQLDNSPLFGPAGTVHCSIEDWAKFVSLHACWKKRNPPLLNPAVLDRLQTPFPGNQDYAYGWAAVERNWGLGRVVSHNGSNTFWMATVWVAPNTDFAVMIVANCCDDKIAGRLDGVVSTLIRRLAR